MFEVLLANSGRPRKDQINISLQWQDTSEHNDWRVVSTDRDIRYMIAVRMIVCVSVYSVVYNAEVCLCYSECERIPASVVKHLTDGSCTGSACQGSVWATKPKVNGSRCTAAAQAWVIQAETSWSWVFSQTVIWQWWNDFGCWQSMASFWPIEGNSVSS